MPKEDGTDHAHEEGKTDLSGLELVKACREHPERYYPMRDHTEQVSRRDKFGDSNIGWYAGLLDENRPFFAECWASDGITMLTIFVSVKGIEDRTPDRKPGSVRPSLSSGTVVPRIRAARIMPPPPGRRVCNR